jgi:hypothetical protein
MTKAHLIFYRRTFVPVSKLQPNFIQERFPYLTHQYYIYETAKWNHYEIPLVTVDLVVLTHYNTVAAAQANGKAEIEVVVADGLSGDDILRFISHTIIFQHLTTRDRYLYAEKLQTYIRGTEAGKVWAEELKAFGLTDINQIIGFLVGYNKESIKILKRIGQQGLDYFDDNLTLTQMLLNATEKAHQHKISKPAKGEDARKVESFSSEGITLLLEEKELTVRKGNHELPFFHAETRFAKNRVIHFYRTRKSDTTIQLTIYKPFFIHDEFARMEKE